MDLPLPDTQGVLPAFPQCLVAISRVTQVPLIDLFLIGMAENSTPGKSNRNENGTEDFGFFQINTINLAELQQRYGFTERDIKSDRCKNATGAAMLIRSRKREFAGRGWPRLKVLATYHSKTADLRDAYWRRLEEIFRRYFRDE